MKKRAPKKKDVEKLKREVVEALAVIVSLFILISLVYSFLNVGGLQGNILRYSVKPLGIIFFSGFLEFFPNFVTSFFVVISAVNAGVNVNFAVLLGIIGSIIGSSLGFFVGKRYLFSMISVFFKEKEIEKTLNGVNRYGKIFMALAALLPLPYLPMIFAAVGIKWRSFLIWGLIPRAIGYIIYGYGFYQLWPI